MYCSPIPPMTTFGLIPIFSDLFVRSEMNQNLFHIISQGILYYLDQIIIKHHYVVVPNLHLDHISKQDYASWSINDEAKFYFFIVRWCVNQLFLHSSYYQHRPYGLQLIILFYQIFLGTNNIILLAAGCIGHMMSLNLLRSIWSVIILIRDYPIKHPNSERWSRLTVWVQHCRPIANLNLYLINAAEISAPCTKALIVPTK